jgi:hypothetical protein
MGNPLTLALSLVCLRERGVPDGHQLDSSELVLCVLEGPTLIE